MANASRRERLRAAQVAQHKRRRIRVIAAAGVAVGAVVVIMAMLWSSFGGSSPKAADRPPNATAASDGIVVNPGVAAAGAPVVGLYLDYQCSHCIEFEEKFGFTMNEMSNKGEIQLINHTKVFLDKGDNNGLSHKAAMAAACADVAGVYKDYHQRIVASARSGPYTDELLRNELPTASGLTGDKLKAFQACYDNKTMLGWVNGVEEASAKAGVTSTPTLMVNGKPLDLNTLTGDDADIRKEIMAAAKG